MEQIIEKPLFEEYYRKDNGKLETSIKETSKVSGISPSIENHRVGLLTIDGVITFHDEQCRGFCSSGMIGGIEPPLKIRDSGNRYHEYRGKHTETTERKDTIYA